MGEPSTTETGDKEPSIARRVLPKLVLSLLLGGLLAWLVQRLGVDIVPSLEAFDDVKWWTVPAYVGLLLATHFFRASRWRFLIAPVKDDIPFWDGVLLNWIGFFAIFALPLRLGELARPALTGPGRKQLVGLEPEDPTVVLDEGAQLIANEKPRPAHNG